MANGKPVEGSLYFYAPNKIAPAIFAAAFLITGAVHLWQCIRYKSFKITALHPFCCLLFVAGFSVREYTAFNYDNLPGYIASQCLIYFAPPLLELANYHVLGRILYYVPYFAPLHPGRTLTTFGSLSTIVEVLNGIGVSYIANKSIPSNLQNLGHILMKISLILQVAVIALFCSIAGVFHWRCAKGGLARVRGVHTPLLTLYASTALILIRTIYRIVEHFGLSSIPSKPGPGYDPMSVTPLVRCEWWFWVFEASIMLVNSVLWNVLYPRRFLPEKYTVYMAQDGKTELEGPGWESNRPLIMTFIDPFDFASLVDSCGKKRKDQGAEQPFWEKNGFENVQLLKKGGQDAV